MKETKENYTYILKCSDGSLYTGWTNCLEKRMAAHQSGRGARYTRSRRPVELVWWESFPTRGEAMSREAAIKRMSRKDKLALIGVSLKGHEGHEPVHEDEVAEASGQDKKMEDLMGSEIFVPGVKERKLQGVDDTSDGINDAAGQKPAEGCRGQAV